MRKINVANIIAVIIILTILFIDYKLDFWYSQNNLKFISESMEEQIINWLELDKTYTNSLKLISAHNVSAGFSSHDKYRELIFKISKEEYEKNKLNYMQDFDSPDMTLKGKKEYDDNSYLCIIRIHIFDDGYYTLGNIINNANIYERIIDIIKFLIISLILIFIGYLNTVNIENNKIKNRRNIIIISTLAAIIAFSLIIYILHNKEENLTEYSENLPNLKNHSQSTTEATQIATETIDTEMKKKRTR